MGRLISLFSAVRARARPWGLVINEAMCAGIPVVVSREVGCVPDLVENGVNGFTQPAGDVEALAAALFTLIEEQITARDYGPGWGSTNI